MTDEEPIKCVFEPTDVTFYFGTDPTPWGLIELTQTSALRERIERAWAILYPSPDDEDILETCPECLAEVRAENLDAHMEKQHTPRPDHFSLLMHLRSEHATGISSDTSLDALIDIHEHEHDGPGTIRNHPRDHLYYDPAKAQQVMRELIEQDRDMPTPPPYVDGPTATTHTPKSERTKRIDKLATDLFEKWCEVDPNSKVAKYPASYMANFADMARMLIDREDT